MLGNADKKLSRNKKESYGIYIFNVLKQVSPQMGASSTTSFVNDLFKRLAGEASKLAKLRKTSTLSFKDIQTSVRLRRPSVAKFAAK